MKELLELVNVINRNKVKTIEVLGNLPSRRTMVQEFYDKLSNGDLNSDQDAAAYFFDATPDERNYKELKKRLTNRLLNTSLFIDVQKSKYGTYQDAYYSCWRDYAIAKVLRGKQANQVAIKLMIKILSHSIKYEFTPLILDISRQLRLYFGTVEFSNKKFKYYNNLNKYYSKLYEAEMLAEEYYTSINMLNKLPSSNEEVILERLTTHLEELEPFAAEYKSYRLQICYYLLKLQKSKMHNNIQETIGVCKFAIEFFKTKTSSPDNVIGIFLRQLFLLYLVDQNFEKGAALLNEAKTYTVEGSVGWFTNYNYFFLLGLHSRNYQSAYNTLQVTLGHHDFKKLPAYFKELWKINQAFIQYLIGIGKIEVKDPKKFKLRKFLNEVPIFSMDKRSGNVSILIIQFLFLLQQKKYNEVIDRGDAINQYCNRHLKRDETFRSNCFIKMLLKIIEASFHKAGAIRKAEKLLEKLATVPRQAATSSYDIEIIPYEDLWEMALDSLDTKFWKTKN